MSELEKAMKAFIRARREDNAISYHKQSLQKAWHGRGFRDFNLNKHWEAFLEGWMAKSRHKADETTQTEGAECATPVDQN